MDFVPLESAEKRGLHPTTFMSTFAPHLCQSHLPVLELHPSMPYTQMFVTQQHHHPGLPHREAGNCEDTPHPLHYIPIHSYPTNKFRQKSFGIKFLKYCHILFNPCRETFADPSGVCPLLDWRRMRDISSLGPGGSWWEYSCSKETCAYLYNLSDKQYLRRSSR